MQRGLTVEIGKVTQFIILENIQKLNNIATMHNE
jgi:hypothetical protein